MEFKRWLEDTGEVVGVYMTNNMANDRFATIASKYMAGKRNEVDKVKKSPIALFGRKFCNCSPK